MCLECRSALIFLPPGLLAGQSPELFLSPQPVMLSLEALLLLQTRARDGRGPEPERNTNLLPPKPQALKNYGMTGYLPSYNGKKRFILTIHVN